MNKRTILATAILVLTIMMKIIITGCSQPGSQGDATGSNQEPKSKFSKLSVQQKMSLLKERAMRVIPLSASTAKFSDEDRRSKLTQDLREMAQLTHKVQDEDLQSFQDPVLKFVTVELESDLLRAAQSLEQGKVEYAQLLTQRATTYCVRCHVQIQKGVVFDIPALSKSIEGLSPFERAKFLTSIRQFDAALESIKLALNNNPKVLSEQLEWERAVRLALSIAIRIDDTPKTTTQILTAIKTYEDIPSFLKNDMIGWQKAVNDWQKEPTKKEGALSAQKQMAQAKGLLKKAQAAQAYKTDRSADLYLLRAQKMLQQMLLNSKQLKPVERAEILAHLGDIAEVMQESQLWSLNEAYFEECIRAVPHTKMARACFARLERSTLIGFSGSMGVSIPAEEMAKLSELRLLAADKVK